MAVSGSEQYLCIVLNDVKRDNAAVLGYVGEFYAYRDTVPCDERRISGSGELLYVRLAREKYLRAADEVFDSVHSWTADFYEKVSAEGGARRPDILFAENRR